jgi:AAA15 family ATPase/GTPase
MIKEIKFTTEQKTIPAGFLLELDNLTVITGENNAGKTNFVKAVSERSNIEFESDEGVVPEIVFIAADNIAPSNDECKSSASSAKLIKRLTALFNNLNIEFELVDKEAAVTTINNLIEKANTNLTNFVGHDKHGLKAEISTGNLDVATMIQALISNIKVNEGGDDRKLEDLGQGTQRIIVASILKAYLDILIEKELCVNKPVLIIFEEPEIFLHPKLKRTLNATLEDIANQPNHQVIITTHDPYFAFSGIDEDGKKIYSFINSNGKTEVTSAGIIDGIEDELLFIYLYSRLKKKIGSLQGISLDNFRDRKYFIEENGQKKEKNSHGLTYIRDQIHHSGDNPYTLGRVDSVPEVTDGLNYYTSEELSTAIYAMSKKLSE